MFPELAHKVEKNLLPRAYVDQFSLAQFSVPPLSWPLVKNLIRKYLGAYPDSVFDSFSIQSKNAASIGQVHQATKNGKLLAEDIQFATPNIMALDMCKDSYKEDHTIFPNAQIIERYEDTSSILDFDYEMMIEEMWDNILSD